MIKILIQVRTVATFVSIILAITPATVFSNENTPLNQLISQDEQKAILDGKILTTAYLKNHKIFSNYSGHDSIKSLTLPGSEISDYSNYEMIAVEKAFIPFELDSENFLGLFNKLTAYRKLTGINYYSRTDEKLQPYILSSYRINSPQNDVAVEDDKHDAVPEEYTAYINLKDNRFGKLMMQSHISIQNNDIIIRNKTLEPMKKMFIRINNAGEYEQQNYFFYDHELKGFYYYSMQAMRIRSGLFLKLSQLTPDNFANRIRALTVHFASLFGHNWQDKLIPKP